MPVAAVATIIISLVIAVAIASYLLRVILVLNDVNDSLGRITFGLRAIAHRLEPVEGILVPALHDLQAVDQALGDTVGSVSQESVA